MARTILLTVAMLVADIALSRTPIRTQKAHVHGEAQLNIAVHGDEGMVEILVPAESVFGFEHQPRTDEQRAKVKKELSELKSAGEQLVLFPEALKCKVEVKSIQAEGGKEADHHHHHGHTDKHQDKKKTHRHHNHTAGEAHDHDHADVKIEYAVKCDQPIKKSEIQIRLAKRYPQIKTTRVQVLTDDKQFGVTLSGTNQTIKLE